MTEALKRTLPLAAAAVAGALLIGVPILYVAGKTLRWAVTR